jgi:hypothetical protein
MSLELATKHNSGLSWTARLRSGLRDQLYVSNMCTSSCPTSSFGILNSKDRAGWLTAVHVVEGHGGHYWLEWTEQVPASSRTDTVDLKRGR